MTSWIDLGGLEFCVVSGGQFRLDGGSMFGVIPRVLWERHDPPDDRNRIQLQTNCILARVAGKTILVDTGNGSKMNEKEREIFALRPGVDVRSNLEAMGIAAEMVDFVILSHLHMDHAGGGTRWMSENAAEPAFPRARYIVQRGEWEDALANHSTMRVTYRKENLVPIQAAGLVDFVDGNTDVMAIANARDSANNASVAVKLECAPGHTPHHQVIHLVGERGRVVFVGDMLPTWSHVRAPYNAAYDLCPYENMQGKQRLLQDASAGGWMIVTTHDFNTPVGRVEEASPGSWKLIT